MAPSTFLHTWGQSPIPNKTQSKNSTRKLTVFYWIHHLDHPHYSIFADTLDLGGIIICRYNGTEDGGIDKNNSIISWSILEGLTHSVSPVKGIFLLPQLIKRLQRQFAMNLIWKLYSYHHPMQCLLSLPWTWLSSHLHSYYSDCIASGRVMQIGA